MGTQEDSGSMLSRQPVLTRKRQVLASKKKWRVPEEEGHLWLSSGLQMHPSPHTYTQRHFH